jgi:hypothetical protein
MFRPPCFIPVWRAAGSVHVVAAGRRCERLTQAVLAKAFNGKLV